jgi:hypothetical protein
MNTDRTCAPEGLSKTAVPPLVPARLSVIVAVTTTAAVPAETLIVAGANEIPVSCGGVVSETTCAVAGVPHHIAIATSGDAIQRRATLRRV